MNPAFKFNRMFGLKLADRLDETYYSILILVLLIFSAIVLTVANLNYSSLQNQANIIIGNRYKEFISQLVDQQKGTVGESKPALIAGGTVSKRVRGNVHKKINTQKIEKTVIAKYVKSVSKANGLSDKYSNLPETDDYIANLDNAEPEQLTYDSKAWPAKSSPDQDGVNNFNAGSVDNPLKHPFNYIIKRQGEVVINFTDELVKGQPGPNGYRDPEEIERVVSEHQPMIEHCFKKAARINPGLKGFVKVAFSISPEGYVLPESIRIISSSLRSIQFERCIKEYIRRWKSFEKLDDSMGIARVVQKFIFN